MFILPLWLTGAGYTLKITIGPKAEPDVILSEVQKYVPTARFKSQESGTSSEVAITLPNDAETTSLFPALFTSLSANKDKLQIETVGLALTTMDEVFLK